MEKKAGIVLLLLLLLLLNLLLLIQSDERSTTYAAAVVSLMKSSYDAGGVVKIKNSANTNTNTNKLVVEEDLPGSDSDGYQSVNQPFHSPRPSSARSLISQASSINHINAVRKEHRFGNNHRISRKASRNVVMVTIGIPMRSTFKQFIEVNDDEKRITGFSIDVFEAAIKLLPYKLIYDLVPFNGSYDDLFREVAVKNFDAAVGDIVIKAEGYQLVQFSQPYVEGGLSMVVKTRTCKLQPWLLIRPFTPAMWFIMAAMCLFTGFVIWFTEQQNHTGSGGSPVRLIGTALWLSFATLYSAQRETPNNSLSHFVLAPWLVLMLVITSTFSASLTSIMFDSQCSASAVGVDVLKRTNAVVGCDGSFLIMQYLTKVLRFKQKNIRSMASIDDYAKALSSGDIEAAFMLMPYAKVILAKYCKRFSSSGPTYKLGNFGFVFQKGSTLALDMSQAILRLSESGDLQLLEEEMLSNFNCSGSLLSDSSVRHSLGPEPFLGLFIISGGASAIALLITLARLLRRHWNRITNVQELLSRGGFWTCLEIFFILMKRRIELQPARYIM